MRAEAVAIGTEILLGQITDTNSVELGRLLAQLGISHTHRQTVGDNLARAVECLQLALSRADIVVVIGGLGPTEDDLTRDALALALDSPLVEDVEVAEHLRSLAHQRRMPWVESQLRQAQRPECARPVSNPNGTAPGLICAKNGRVVLAMPGPPNEFVPMLRGPIAEFLANFAGSGVIHSKVLRVVGLGESVAEDRLRDLLGQRNPTLAPYAKLGEVHFRLTARAANTKEAESLIEPLESEVRLRLGVAVYADGDTSLEQVVLQLLREQGQTLAVAESCTGGLLAARVTQVPGSSDVFLGGVVSYSNALKRSLLAVPEHLLEVHGAVSSQVALAMARGCLSRLGSDWAIAVTGVAGPGGGSEQKPLGTVHVALIGPGVEEESVSVHIGSRETVRQRSVVRALNQLRLCLLAR